jgi:hypothetical protein
VVVELCFLGAKVAMEKRGMELLTLVAAVGVVFGVLLLIILPRWQQAAAEA